MSEQPPPVELIPFPNLNEVVDLYKEKLDWDTLTPEDRAQYAFTIKEMLCLSVLRTADDLFAEESEIPLTTRGPCLVRFMKTMFPDSMNFMEFRWLPDLLRASTVHRFPTAINDRKYIWLRLQAFKRLTLGADSLSAEEKAHLEGISRGDGMPPGVYSKHHARWVLYAAEETLSHNETAVDEYRRQLDAYSAESGPPTEEEVLIALKKSSFD